MRRLPTDTARRRASSASFEPADCPVTLRSYRDTDFPAVRRLYHEGLLNEQVVPMDSATDPQILVDRYCTNPKDHLWVGEIDGRVVATVGIREEESGIGHLRRLRVDHDWLAWEDGNLVRMLIARAADHARQHELLKLVIHTALNDERAVAFLHKVGFEFARIRDRDGQHLLEFYLNIYQPTVPAPSARP